MSSTNVHSKQENKPNYQVIVAPWNITENELTIPPKTKDTEQKVADLVDGYKEMEITIGNGVLNENGILKTENGEIQFGKQAYENVEKNRKNRAKLQGKEQKEESR